MAIGRISGPMLTRNLERQGQDLSVDGNLIYFDVTNRRIGINNDIPVSTLDVHGNVFAGNGVTVGSENIPIYRLPKYAPPTDGRIIISTDSLETIWSNIVRVNEANALVTISGSSNITDKLFVGNLVTVGNNNVELYSLPEEAPGFGQILVAEGGPSKRTFWAPAPPVIAIRRRKYTTTVNLLGYGNVDFVLPIGVSSIVYAVTVSRPVKLEVFGTAARNEPNPYTFIATPDHLTDDGTVILNDGSSFQSRQYSIFANLEDPIEPNVYATMTSVDPYLAATPVTLELFYFPAVTDSGAGNALPYSGNVITGGGGGGGNVTVSQTPTVVTATTPTLAVGDSVNLNIVGYQGYGLYKIQVSNPAWVRIYTSTAARSSDSSRIITTDPTPDVGLITEVITNLTPQTIQLTPAVLGYNAETPATTTIPLRVTNTGATSAAITVWLTISYIYG